MCIVFFGKSKKNGLIITFNRDEFLLREADKLGLIDPNFANEHGFSSDIIYCKDVPTGGTFFAINKQNLSFCFLLNHPFKNNSYKIDTKLKRGEIPLLFCSLPNECNNTFNNAINHFVSKLKEHDDYYNGYNIVFGSLKYEKMFYYTNNHDYLLENFGEKIQLPYEFDLTTDQFYGISNYSLFQSVDKINYGIELLNKRVNNESLNSEELMAYLFEVMQTKTKFVDNKPINEYLSKYNSKHQVDMLNPEVLALRKYMNSSIFVQSNVDEIAYTGHGTRQTYIINSLIANSIIDVKITEHFANIKLVEESLKLYSPEFCDSMSMNLNCCL